MDTRIYMTLFMTFMTSLTSHFSPPAYITGNHVLLGIGKKECLTKMNRKTLDICPMQEEPEGSLLYGSKPGERQK